MRYTSLHEVYSAAHDVVHGTHSIQEVVLTLHEAAAFVAAQGLTVTADAAIRTLVGHLAWLTGVATGGSLKSLLHDIQFVDEEARAEEENNVQ